MPPIIHLVRGVPNNYVKLHVGSKQLGDPSLDVVCVYERIGVVFSVFAPIQRRFACSAEFAFAFRIPCMLCPLEPDIPGLIVEAPRHRVLPVGEFRAIDAAPCHQTGQLGGSDAKNLLGQDVIHPLLKVWNLTFQPQDQALCDLAEEHP